MESGMPAVRPRTNIEQSCSGIVGEIGDRQAMGKMFDLEPVGILRETRLILAFHSRRRSQYCSNLAMLLHPDRKPTTQGFPGIGWTTHLVYRLRSDPVPYQIVNGFGLRKEGFEFVEGQGTGTVTFCLIGSGCDSKRVRLSLAHTCKH